MTNVAIVGGGIGGLTVATCLRRRGIDAQVYEQAPELREVGAGVQISPNAARLLHGLGITDRLEAVAVQPRVFQIRRWNDDSVIFESPLAGVCEKRFGWPYYTLHRSDLHEALLAALPEDVVHCGRRLVAVRDGDSDVRLAFEDGSDASADVLIGADGLRSVVRDSLVPDTPRFSEHVACRGLVPRDRVAELVAQNAVILWVGPDKHMIAYPVRAGTLMNWALTIPSSEPGPESWTREGTTEEALGAMDGWNATARTLVGATDGTLVVSLYDREPMPRLTNGRIALLGDAAHPMLPTMAQGAVQAIEDAWVLADSVTELDDRPIPDRLRLYGELRAERTAEIQRRARASSDMYHVQDEQQQEQRDRRLQGGAMSIAAFDWLYGYDATKAIADALQAPR